MAKSQRLSNLPNAPAFRVVPGSNSGSITASTPTKVALTSETFDTASAFDSSTNYRFTPQVAGYYQINASVLFYGSGSSSNCYAAIYKNGSFYSGALGFYHVGNGTNTATLSDLVYLNGSTDYVELYGRSETTDVQIYTVYNQSSTFMSGYLARPAA